MILKASKIGLVTPTSREEEALKRLGRIGYSVRGCGQLQWVWSMQWVWSIYTYVVCTVADTCEPI